MTPYDPAPQIYKTLWKEAIKWADMALQFSLTILLGVWLGRQLEERVEVRHISFVVIVFFAVLGFWLLYKQANRANDSH